MKRKPKIKDGIRGIGVSRGVRCRPLWSDRFKLHKPFLELLREKNRGE